MSFLDAMYKRGLLNDPGWRELADGRFEPNMAPERKAELNNLITKLLMSTQNQREESSVGDVLLKDEHALPISEQQRRYWACQQKSEVEFLLNEWVLNRMP